MVGGCTGERYVGKKLGPYPEKDAKNTQEGVEAENDEVLKIISCDKCVGCGLRDDKGKYHVTHTHQMK